MRVLVRETLIGPRFEFDLSPSSSSSLSSVRPSDQESESEFEGSWEVSSGRHGRRRFLGKGRGEKGEMSMGLMVGYLVGVVWGGVLM